jgi:hypothetical protein
MCNGCTASLYHSMGNVRVCAPPRLGCSSSFRAGAAGDSALARAALEVRDVLEPRRPRLRRTGPRLHRRLNPRCVVQRPRLDEDQLWRDRSDAEDRGAAGRAELAFRLAAVVLTGRREGGEGVCLAAERGPRHTDEHRERAAGLTLAVRAATDCLEHRICIGGVGHGTTQAVPGDRLRR